MTRLTDYGIAGDRDGAAVERFERLVPDFFARPELSPRQYLSDFWARYCETFGTGGEGGAGRSLNGKVAEYAVATLLLRLGIHPFYMGASVSLVPNADFDIVLCDAAKGPVCLSIKTSLRERYKQADLEAFALRNVHRKSRNYLITFDRPKARIVAEAIAAGEVLGLTAVLHPDLPGFNDVFEDLRGGRYTQPRDIPFFQSTQHLVRPPE